MTQSVFIMCNGQAQRFDGEIKQLLPIGSTTILGRILTQLSSMGCNTTVVTHHQEIIDAVPDDINYLLTEPTPNVCESILKVTSAWTENNVILLGDVIYSNIVLQNILNHRRLMFFGDLWETYALTFPIENHQQLSTALNNSSLHMMGKLRHAYYSFCNLRFNRSETVTLLRSDPHFKYIDCWITRDCDLPSQYENIQRELVQRGVLDRE
jgi:hypothetical protein